MTPGRFQRRVREWTAARNSSAEVFFSLLIDSWTALKSGCQLCQLGLDTFPLGSPQFDVLVLSSRTFEYHIAQGI